MELLSIGLRSAPDLRSLRVWYRRWTDFESQGLIHLFREAGFANPRPRAYLDSAIPASALAVVEHADRIQDGAGVCVEARR